LTSCFFLIHYLNSGSAEESKTIVLDEPFTYNGMNGTDNNTLYGIDTLDDYEPDGKVYSTVLPALQVGADGHQITLINNLTARNPTYQEVIDFIKSDQTDKIEYNSSSFVCGDYAELVHNNAERAGIKCGWVSLSLSDGTGHACNSFNTTDKGLIWIDCTSSDHVLNPIPSNGEEYKPENFDINYESQSCGDLVDSHTFW
jgi:hypothetical protein